MLRLLSFNLDYYWAYRSTPAPDVNIFASCSLFISAHSLFKLGEPSTHKERTSIAHPLGLYSFANFLAYISYAPLYIGGPIMTFNDFIWQVR